MITAVAPMSNLPETKNHRGGCRSWDEIYMTVRLYQTSVSLLPLFCSILFSTTRFSQLVVGQLSNLARRRSTNHSFRLSLLSSNESKSTSFVTANTLLQDAVLHPQRFHHGRRRLGRLSFPERGLW